MRWPAKNSSGLQLNFGQEETKERYHENALKKLDEIIGAQEEREEAFLKSLGLNDYTDLKVIPPNLIKEQAGKGIPDNLVNLIETLENQLNQQDNTSIKLDQLLSQSNKDNAQQLQLYNLLKEDIIRTIKDTIGKKDQKNVSSGLAAKVARKLYAYYEELLQKAGNDKDNLQIINNSFNKIFAILSRVELHINKDLSKFLENYLNYPVSNAIADMKQGLQEMQTEITEKNGNSKKGTQVIEGAKAIKIERNGETIYQFNFENIITSITKSISGLTNNLRGKALEQLIAQALEKGNATFNVGSVSIPTVELTGDKRVSGGKMLNHQKNARKGSHYYKINQYKENALKYGRNAKADVTYTIGDASYGISAKAGQEKKIKLDTRGSFYSFLNFIGHYRYGSVIAKSLENYNNIMTILGELGPKGNSTDFSELNEALAVIAYSFFGYVDDNASIDLEYFYGQNDELKRYQNNTVIITDKGEIKKISPYLHAIRNIVVQDAKREFDIKTTFSVDTEKKNKYQESIYKREDIYEAMQYVTAQTYLKQLS